VQGVDYTLLDIDRHKFHYGREPLIVGAPDGSPNGVSLRGDHVAALGDNGRDTVSLDLDGYQLNVNLRQTKPPALMFGDGFATFYCNSSHYYARTRMTVTGTLTGPDGRARVRGQGWFDHQWGFLPALSAARWQYAQMQLADGRDIFLGHLTFPPGRADFREDLGIISDRQGHVTTLHHGDFTITPTGYWRRDATCAYPVELSVTVNAEHFTIRPTVRDAELRATGSPAELALWPENPVYWDGETVIGGDATGRGWLDLAKYCNA
jgi:predicted secreted hydrolase